MTHAADTCQAGLRAAAQLAAAVDAPSQVLSTAEQATAYLATTPRGRLEQTLIDLGVRDAELLRQGAGLDQTAQRVLAQAHRSGLASPERTAQTATEPDAAASASQAVTTTRAAAASRTEPAIRQSPAAPSHAPSRRAGEAGHPSAFTEPSASLDAPEIGDEEPEPGL